jgi:hypothetical protein
MGFIICKFLRGVKTLTTPDNPIITQNNPMRYREKTTQNTAITGHNRRIPTLIREGRIFLFFL